jgi:hypothetical protein
LWGGALVVGCSEWGCSLELLQAESARAETKHIANSQVNFLVWFFMSFLWYAAESVFEKSPGQGTGPTGLRDIGHFP